MNMKQQIIMASKASTWQSETSAWQSETSAWQSETSIWQPKVSAWPSKVSAWMSEAAQSSLLTFKRMTETMKKSITPLCQYYSRVLERPIDLRQTLLLVQAQVAFVLAALPAECPLLLRAAFALWFGWSVRVCKHSL